MNNVKLIATPEALKRYDIEDEKLSKMIDDNVEPSELMKQFNIVDECEKLVKLAYYTDTSDRNSKETCMSLHIGPKEPVNPDDLCFVRKMVKQFS